LEKKNGPLPGGWVYYNAEELLIVYQGKSQGDYGGWRREIGLAIGDPKILWGPESLVKAS